MSSADLSSGNLSKYSFESFPCIAFKGKTLSSRSHFESSRAARPLLTLAHKKEGMPKEIWVIGARQESNRKVSGKPLLPRVCCKAFQWVLFMWETEVLAGSPVRTHNPTQHC